MPTKCCVPNCRGNYKNGPQVSTFTFPKSEDLKRKWLAAIKKRIDFEPSPNSRVSFILVYDTVTVVHNNYILKYRSSVNRYFLQGV